MLYVAVDGDDIGQLLTQRIYKVNNEHEVIQFSKLVTNTFAQVARWVIQNQGEVLFCTGDSILFKIPEALLDVALNHLKLEHFTVSVGVGRTLREAHWALNVAKSLGKARVVHFDEVRKDIWL
ncbi:mCpol domain-containing protein [Dehalococcoidales bacterium]|nr:mCpol domain-containing protein [Dehalococcoidales bacterium]